MNGGLVPPSGAEVFGKTLVISPPTMLMASHLPHHRTGHSGHSELGMVSETEGGEAAIVAVAGGVAMQPASSSGSSNSSSGGHHSPGSSRSSSHSRGGETRGAAGADLPMALHPSQTIAAEAV